MANIDSLIESYAQGAALLRGAVRTAPDSCWDLTPIKGAWSIRQVVCHLADSEIVYADRMKRVLAEDNPTLFEADPNLFVPALHCSQRSWSAELNLIEMIRAHMLPILRACNGDDFRRAGVHSLDGPLTLEMLLARVTAHIPHHVAFIEEKLRALSC